LRSAALAGLVCVLLAGVAIPRRAGSETPDPTLARGRMLVAFGGCNECHTPGWAENDGNVPVTAWMTGSSIGYRGPWGTSYPANVRLWFQVESEDAWLRAVATRGGHPPMRWTDLRVLSVADRRAIYRFIRSLGPAGVPAPKDLPPGEKATTPVVDVIPQPAPGR
jgi:mono/diheme cytochrome c family protein